jgi:hypothetical protein
MQQSEAASVEAEPTSEEGGKDRPLYKPVGWQWKTIAAVAFGQSIPGFYAGVAYGSGALVGSVFVLYALVVCCRFVASLVGWDGESGVFAQVSVLAAVASIPAGAISIPTIPVYILLILVIYIPLQLLISGGRALFAYGSGSNS